MAAVEPIAYTDAKIRRILATVRTIAMVGASTNWNRPSYFVMKYLQGKGYRVHPGQSVRRGTGTAGRARICLAARHPGAGRHGRHLPRLGSGRPDRRRCDRDRRQGGVDAARHPQRRSRFPRGGGRHRSDHEPLPQDRVRPPGGELSWSGVNSGIIRNRAADRPPNARRSHVRNRRPMSATASDARRPRRRRTGSHHRRAHHADLQTTAYVFDDVDHAASLFDLRNSATSTRG